MDRVIYVIGHRNPDADSICSAIAYAHLKGLLGEPGVRPARPGEVDAETAFVLRWFDVPEPELVTDATGLDLILVDHNEISLAISGIEHANILEVWEHHRLGDLRPADPIVFHCEPVGATATLIGEQYFAYGLTPPRDMAGLMLAAIFSDTVLLRSPTVSEKDRAIASRLGSLAGIGWAFGEEMLRVKTAEIDRWSAEEIVCADYKELNLGGAHVGIGQVEVTRPHALSRRKEKIFRVMRALRERANLTQVILMITDVEARASDLWFVGDRRDLFEQAFGPLRDDTIRLEGCMSRKKQVVPPLEHAFETAAVRGGLTHREV